MKLSSAVVLYFAVNSTFSMLQTSLLRNRWFRRKMKIVNVARYPPDPANTYDRIFAAIRKCVNTVRERTEKRRLTREEEERIYELIKKKRNNERIKVVRSQGLET